MGVDNKFEEIDSAETDKQFLELLFRDIRKECKEAVGCLPWQRFWWFRFVIAQYRLLSTPVAVFPRPYFFRASNAFHLPRVLFARSLEVPTLTHMINVLQDTVPKC